MENWMIEQYIKNGKLRKRQIDIPRINSLLDSARSNAVVMLKIPLNEDSATPIFKELYESIRQIGDARWWSLGYEPVVSHEVSMEILMEMKVRESIKLNRLDNFRKIRNSASYRGYKVSVGQAKEIIDFWKSCAEELIADIQKTIKKK